ncbi:hypothetical protein GCM10012275_34550 [Longimycelium tulufanense]|uniref:Uncharacterized protein n=1 Tax=Longimycelium tulufanense TaxID=907463 RepID=A0A8J3C9J3_9PSEU|nr:hypothetical protein GCM10012275_34550 [Longimycelium tulufanense]
MDSVSGKETWAFSVAKLTVARTPSSLFSLRSTWAAHEAQVMPPIDSSTSCTVVLDVSWAVDVIDANLLSG